VLDIIKKGCYFVINNNGNPQRKETKMKNDTYKTLTPGGFTIQPWERFDYSRIQKIAESMNISLTEEKAEAIHIYAKKLAYNDDGWLINILKQLADKS
jgi:hypothetical protein